MTDSGLKAAENQPTKKMGRIGSAKLNNLLKKADIFRKRQQYDHAIIALNEAAELNPKLEVIFVMLAEIYRQIGKDQLALYNFNQAIALDPGNAGLYILRGELYRLLRQPQEALADLNRSLLLKPEAPQALGERGTIYRNTGQFYLALADFNRALEFDPHNTWLIGNRAETYRHLGEYRKALADYSEILTISPDQIWVYERRSYANLRLGYLEKAQQDFEQNFSRNPQNVLAGWMVEWVKMCKRYFAFTPEVAQTLKNLAEMSPDTYEGALCRSSLAWLQEEYLPAFQEADIATKLEAGRPEAFFWKGLAEAVLSEDGEAFVSIQKAIDLKLPPILLGPANLLRARKPGFYQVYEARFLRKTGPLILPGTPMDSAEPFSFNEGWTVPNKPKTSAANLEQTVSEALEETDSQVEGLVEETEEIPYLEVMPEEMAEEEAGIVAQYVELVGDESNFESANAGESGPETAQTVTAFPEVGAESATEAAWKWEIPAPLGAEEASFSEVVEAEPVQEAAFNKPGVDEVSNISSFVDDAEAAAPVEAETEQSDPVSLEEYPDAPAHTSPSENPGTDEPISPAENLESVEPSTAPENLESVEPYNFEPVQPPTTEIDSEPAALASLGEPEAAYENDGVTAEVAPQFEATRPIEEVITPRVFNEEWAYPLEDENLVSDFTLNKADEETATDDEAGATFVPADSDEVTETAIPLTEVENYASKNEKETATLSQPEGAVEENARAAEESVGEISPVEENSQEELAHPVESIEAASTLESIEAVNSPDENAAPVWDENLPDQNLESIKIEDSTDVEPETSDALESNAEGEAASNYTGQSLETAEFAGNAPTERFSYLARPAAPETRSKPLSDIWGQMVDSAEIAPYFVPPLTSPEIASPSLFQPEISEKEPAYSVEAVSADEVETSPVENEVEGAEEHTSEFDSEATQPFRLSDLRRNAVEDQEFKTFIFGKPAVEPEQEIAPFIPPASNLEAEPDFTPFDQDSPSQKATSTEPENEAEAEIAQTRENPEGLTQPFRIFDNREPQGFEPVQPDLPQFSSSASQADNGEAVTQQFEVQPTLEPAFTEPEKGQEQEAATAAEATAPVPAEPGFAQPVNRNEDEGDARTLPAFVIPAAEVAPYTRPVEAAHQEVASQEVTPQEAATQPFAFVPATASTTATIPPVVDAPTVPVRTGIGETSANGPVTYNGTRPTGPAASSASNTANVPPTPPNAPATTEGWNMRNFAVPLIVLVVIVVGVIGFLLLGPKGQGTPTPQGAIQATLPGQTTSAQTSPTAGQATAVATVVLGGQNTTAASTTAVATTAPATTAVATAAAPTTAVPATTIAAATATVAVPTATLVPPTAAPATTAAPTATTVVTASPTTAPATTLTADVLKKFTNQNLSGHFLSVYSVAFSPDGKTLASGSNDRTIKIWQINGASSPAQPLVTLNGHQDAIYSVAFSPDGKMVASGSADRTVKIWQFNGANSPKNPVFTLTGHDGGVNLVAFSPDGKTVASASEDKTIKLWDVTTGKLVKTLEGHTFLVNSIAFSPDGKTLVSGSNDKTLRLWDVASGKTSAVLTGHDNFVNSVAFSPDGKTVASGSSDRSIKLWDVASGKVITTITGHPTGVTFVTFSPDGKTLASGGTDNSIKVWDVSNAAQSVPQLTTLESGSVGVFSLAFSSNGQVLAEADRSTSIKLWDFGVNIFNEK